MRTQGVINASCDFDVETLRPTYKLLIGIPGKSNAFAISKRLGLEDAVIERAKAQMDSESVRFEDILTKLEQQRQSMERDQVAAARMKSTAESDAKRAREFREQMERARQNARGKAEKEARRILEDARMEAERVFAELNRMRKEAEKLRDIQKENDERAALMRGLNAAEEKLQSMPEETEKSLQRLLRELGEDELRHADTLLMILADSMAGRGC